MEQGELLYFLHSVSQVDAHNIVPIWEASPKQEYGARRPMVTKRLFQENLLYLLHSVSQVDAHNIVPIWEASPKQEYGARTIRKKIWDKMSTYLTEFPPVAKHPHQPKTPAEVRMYPHTGT